VQDFCKDKSRLQDMVQEQGAAKPAALLRLTAATAAEQQQQHS
jgi:hypothetical protein